ncbi:MAG: hypothetical protein ACC655_08755, partial [Rhodothermia bacterium]
EVPDGVLPDDALRDGSLFQFRSDEVSPFIFGPDDHPSFPMTPGRRYAWQVTATDPTGTVYVSRNGASVVRSFTYSALDAELAVLADAGDISFSPAQPDHTIPIRVRMFSSGSGSTEIAILRSVRIMILDGMRIVYASEDAPMEALPVSFTTWVTANVNVSLPLSAIDEILGSRDTGRFTMQIHVNADPSGGGDPISGFDEFDVDIVRAEIVATMTRPAAMPVRLDLSNPRIPVEIEFVNATSSDVTLSRLHQVWTFEDIGPVPYDGPITESGDRTVTVPARGRTTLFTSLSADADRLSSFYTDRSGILSEEGDISIAYTFQSSDGRVSVDADPPLELFWTSAILFDTLLVATEEPPQPHLYTGQLDGPSVRFTFSNFGREDITLTDWTREVYSASGTFIGRVDERLPRTIVVPSGGGSAFWPFHERRGSGAHRIMEDAIAVPDGPVDYEIMYQFFGRQTSGNRHSASTDPRIRARYTPNSLSAEILNPAGGVIGAGDLVYNPSDTVQVVRTRLTNNAAHPLVVSEIRGRVLDASGRVQWTIAPVSTDERVEPGVPLDREGEPLRFSRAQQATLLSGVGGADEATFFLEYFWTYTDVATEQVGETFAGVPITVRRAGSGFGFTADAPGGIPLIFDTGSNYQPINYEFTNTTTQAISVTRQTIIRSEPDGTWGPRNDFEVPGGAIDVPAGGTFVSETRIGFNAEAFGRISRDPALEGVPMTFRVIFTGSDELGTIYRDSTDVGFQLGGGVLTVEASAEGGFPLRITTGDPTVPVTYTFRNSGDSDISIGTTSTTTFDRSGATISGPQEF